MDNSDNMENEQKIGELSKVSLLGFVDIDGVESIPSVYSRATGSMNLLSSVNHIDDKNLPNAEYLQFKHNSEIGAQKTIDSYIKKDGFGIKDLKILERYSITAIPENFGDVKGTVQDGHYSLYLIDSKTKKEDYSQGVEFLPVKELKEMMAKAGDPNLIHMDVGGTSYRINRGVTYALELYSI